VFGEGPTSARIVLVGEQPGDREDLTGHPFVGPAGGLLDRALTDAGIARNDVYVTNAVKHFKFEERGKRRIHKKPSDSEVEACKPWLWAELTRIRPEAVICLGATAARALLGKEHRVLKDRGQLLEHPLAGIVASTVHPSAILRAPDAERREADYRTFVKDLAKVGKAVNAQRSKIRVGAH
jgi:DNA polymerase